MALKPKKICHKEFFKSIFIFMKTLHTFMQNNVNAASKMLTSILK